MIEKKLCYVSNFSAAIMVLVGITELIRTTTNTLKRRRK